MRDDAARAGMTSRRSQPAAAPLDTATQEVTKLREKRLC